MTKSVLTFLAGMGVGGAILWSVNISPTSVQAALKEDPAFRSLDANLYMQTAAEYRACCYQAYNSAEMMLKIKLEKATAKDKPFAVVLDLDETVLDNGAFQTKLIRAEGVYDQKIWTDWEDNHKVDVYLVPGAKDFLLKCNELNVKTVFISNRNENSRKNCKAILEHHGIGVPDEQLHLATVTSDKTARRALVQEKFTVLMYMGDNLRDFHEKYKYDATVGIPGRFAKVDEDKKLFGTEWFIFPNTAYGEWAKAFGNGAKDADLLKPQK